jgi:hypothetical protein
MITVRFIDNSNTHTEQSSIAILNAVEEWLIENIGTRHVDWDWYREFNDNFEMFAVFLDNVPAEKITLFKLLFGV